MTNKLAKKTAKLRSLLSSSSFCLSFFTFNSSKISKIENPSKREYMLSHVLPSSWSFSSSCIQVKKNLDARDTKQEELFDAYKITKKYLARGTHLYSTHSSKRENNKDSLEVTLVFIMQADSGAPVSYSASNSTIDPN